MYMVHLASPAAPMWTGSQGKSLLLHIGDLQVCGLKGLSQQTLQKVSA